MIKFPLEFEVNIEAKEGISTPWNGQGNAHVPIGCSIPVEFGGPGGGYTPEDLFALATLNCIISDFKVFCYKKRESFSKIKGKACLTLDLINQKLIFSNLDITLEVEGAIHPDVVKAILEESIANCPVCNCIKMPKILHITMK